jgi:hypothetical protein
LNTFKGFDVQVAQEIADMTKLPFETAPNKVISMKFPLIFLV